jgi:hypothetical protein
MPQPNATKGPSMQDPGAVGGLPEERVNED